MMSDWLMRALRRARWMAPPDGDNAVAADAASAGGVAGAVKEAPLPAAAPAPNGSAEPGGQPAAADSTPAAEPAKVESSPSLLSSADTGKTPESPPAPEAKPAEAKAPEAPPQAETPTDPAKDATPQPEAPAPLTFEDLTLPDGARADAPEALAFIELVNNGELTRKDFAQGLLDLHRKDIERVYQEAADRQQQFWQQLNRGWQEELRNDREIGGNRLMTSLSKAKGFIEEILSPNEATLLLKHADANGMGNYMPFIRMLVKAADRLNIYEDGMIVSNPAPQKPQLKPGSRGWYDNSIDRIE